MIQQPNQPVDRDVPNFLRIRGGWYPRWWVLSVFLCSVLIIFGFLFGNLIPCPTSAGFLCQEPSWHPVLQVLLIWGIFVLAWLIIMIFGIGPIEIPRRERSRVALFVRSISEFGPLHSLLVIYGMVALLALVAMWLLDRTTPLAFAVLAMVVFVANCSYFQQLSPREQRSHLFRYGLLGLITALITFIFRRQSVSVTPFFLAEGLLVAFSIWAFFWHPRPARQLTAQEELDENIARAGEPLFLLRNIWPINRFFPNRPITTN